MVETTHGHRGMTIFLEESKSSCQEGFGYKVDGVWIDFADH